jgi:hypothetical protein
MSKKRKLIRQKLKVASWKGGPCPSRSIYYTYKEYRALYANRPPKEDPKLKPKVFKLKVILTDDVQELKKRGEERRSKLQELDASVAKKMKKVA